jgi:hypothetical protein
MFVFNPDQYLTPSYRISPFTTADVGRNSKMAADDFAVQYFNSRFGQHQWQYTANGREAIRLALKNYELQATDIVTILTTSQNFYISSCVTSEIESICQWNRELTTETKLIFVNHEFGYPYPNMAELVATGLPIIEDCCTTFFSQDEAGTLGKYGDFSVYSFPKFFPIQIGGLLVSNKNKVVPETIQLTMSEKQYVENVVSYYLRQQMSILKNRKENYDYAVNLFLKLGFTPRFTESKHVIPSVLLLKNNGIIQDLNQLKLALYACGIQNSIFYGEDAFFIPLHQHLSIDDIDYFAACTAHFKNQNRV